MISKIISEYQMRYSMKYMSLLSRSYKSRIRCAEKQSPLAGHRLSFPLSPMHWAIKYAGGKIIIKEKYKWKNVKNNEKTKCSPRGESGAVAKAEPQKLLVS